MGQCKENATPAHSSRATPLPHQHIDTDIDIYKFLRVGARKAHRKRTGAMSPPHQPINICICIHTYTPIYKHFSCIGTATWAFDVIVGIGLMYHLQSKNIYHVCIIPRYIFYVLWCPRYASSIHKWLRPVVPWSHWFGIWNTQGSWPYGSLSTHVIHILIAKRMMLILPVFYLYETWFHSYCTQSSKWGAPMFQYLYKFLLLGPGTK